MRAAARRGETSVAPLPEAPPPPRPLRYITLGEVESMTSLKRSTIERRMKEGAFPRPRDLGGRCVRWLESEVEDWMRQRPVATAHVLAVERSVA